jgi:hypothetical protein
MVHVPEYAEPELRILVEDLAFGHTVVEMRRDEILILQHVPNERANFLAALDAGILRKNTVTFAGELLECVAH